MALHYYIGHQNYFELQRGHLPSEENLLDYYILILVQQV